ncbi:MAG: hypothetical protein HUJ30_05180 [Gammaproteobacteria bacterium]|nr:hypothetical protein [Gammaproteobacteria bacterium]
MKTKTIGRCEGWCGLIDHHLIDGMCEQCRARLTLLHEKQNEETDMSCNDSYQASLLSQTPAHHKAA